MIYRPEPSPSLTPLLRNYTQSVANKSKKVSAVLVRIHGTYVLPRSIPPFLLYFCLPPWSRVLTTFALASLSRRCSS